VGNKTVSRARRRATVSPDTVEKRVGRDGKVRKLSERGNRPRAPAVDGSVILSLQGSGKVVVCWSKPVLDFEELRELAADVRVFIDLADDKAATLRDIIGAYDVVLGIYPSGDEMGIYVVKGRSILDKIAKSKSTATYAYTAIAVPDIQHAESLRHLTTPAIERLAA
jgi:hypothetical protein